MGAPLHGAHALLPPIDAIGPPSLSIRLKKKMKTVTLCKRRAVLSEQAADSRAKVSLGATCNGAGKLYGRCGTRCWMTEARGSADPLWPVWA